ncbi:hypothetical protein F442_19560 [Phytophthora nicotianae P10297]|uniref:Uncharacterized protein n=1 Tax=Phytophthora nicotianae P10297 TaxID=1317064 RepID=W2YAC8_PHYNI|nr:hypothetical protein F442_19560 [Phytophthora nicotianae P10297]
MQNTRCPDTRNIAVTSSDVGTRQAALGWGGGTPESLCTHVLSRPSIRRSIQKWRTRSLAALAPHTEAELYALIVSGSGGLHEQRITTKQAVQRQTSEVNSRLSQALNGRARVCE